MIAGDAAVAVDDLHVRYGTVHAVRGVSFEAAVGQVTAVLGPNGAGKTSMIEVCEGLRRATEGGVRVLGLDPATQQRRLTERIGVMLQDGGVYPGATVGQVMRQFVGLAGGRVDGDALISRVGLDDRRAASWRSLSGGERQRLSLALALTNLPEVAFLDEPTSGVDINGRDTIRAIVRELAGRGCAVVLATHELDEAERLADRVVIIDRGVVVADGTLAELRRGHDEIRFSSSAALDLVALATATGLIASRVGTDEYVIDAPAQPRIIAQLTGWLADQGHPIGDLRGGAQRLEDVFRRLTAATDEGAP